jgi:hypothetical protein
MGDYAAVVLAWRGDASALTPLQAAYTTTPSVGRALARGTLGDKTALQDLLTMCEAHKSPLSVPMMDETMRGYAAKLPALGIVSAEQAFELLAHQRFGFTAAMSASEKKKAVKKACSWLTQTLPSLTLDKKSGYYVLPAAK